MRELRAIALKDQTTDTWINKKIDIEDIVIKTAYIVKDRVKEANEK